MDQSSLFPQAEPLVQHAAYVRVAVERGIESLDGPDGLTYGCQTPAPRVGERVIVPLGKKAHAAGIVLEVGGDELAAGMSPTRIKPIVEKTGAVLPPDLLTLGQWMSEYYVCPLGMVLSAVMPAAVKAGTGRTRVVMVSLAAASGEDPAELKPGARKLLATLRTWAPTDFPLPLRELLARANAGPGAAKSLIAANILIAQETEQVKAGDLPFSQDSEPQAPLNLSDAQRHAIEGIAAAMGRFSVHLLRGVTGSGKTEVYLRLIAQVLEAGGTALVLVPEIALTPQTSARFTRRFGAGAVAVLHSGLTAAQRHREWRRAGEGAARVVVGARSAVFAPLARLGLIVVDEEHDASYKQDRLPRFSGRDVAIKRAQIAGCPVLLGSATPSLESWHNASGAPARSTLWELPQRVGAASLPAVRIVDMSAERRERWNHSKDRQQHLLGPTLDGALESSLRAGEQVILLLNRRGFASYISCTSPSCGFVLSCDQCDANLVLHKYAHLPVGGIVQCHHCEAQQLVPRTCPVCASKLNLFSGGTQRLEEELLRKFGHLGIEEGRTMIRVDRDTMRSGRDFFDALERFGKGEAQLLLGTQMIAKGLDFPGVSLVGVVDADTSLNIPDFRAAERTFQLISQVAGRAGRGSRPGLVIVQTHNPRSPAIVLAARHDYITFARAELAIRRRARLPPVSRMARIVCRDRSAQKAQEAGETLVALLRQAAPPEVSIRGPVPCPITKIAGMFRAGVDVLAPSANVRSNLLATLRARGAIKSDLHTAVDVDPLSLM